MTDFDKTTTPPAGSPVGYPVTQPAPKRLLRSSSDSWISGVCGGIGAYLDVDANLVRLVFVLGTIFGFGTFLVVYVIAWILMPRD